MNHSFAPGIDPLLCNKCKRPTLDHSDEAICECCPNVGPCEVYMTMLMCPSCLDKQKELQAKSESEAETRVLSQRENIDARIKEIGTIDSAVQVKSDIFNAETVAIVEIKKLVDSDDSISAEDKNFKLASLLTDRINGFKRAITELNLEVIDKVNAQRAIQVYLNEMSNKLRVEEREKLKLQDINYQPAPQKVSKPRTPKVPKFDKAELLKWAQFANVPPSIIQMICVSKGVSPEIAANQLKG